MVGMRGFQLVFVFFELLVPVISNLSSAKQCFDLFLLHVPSRAPYCLNFTTLLLLYYQIPYRHFSRLIACLPTAILRLRST